MVATLSLNDEIKRQQMLLLSDKLMLTSEEATKILGIGRNTLDALSKARYIPHIEVGTKKCYPRWALDEFTRNFIFKRINLQTLEVSHIDNNYDEFIQQLQQENETLKNKLNEVKQVLS